MRIECKDCKKIFPESKIIMIQRGIVQGMDFSNEVRNKIMYVCDKCNRERIENND